MKHNHPIFNKDDSNASDTCDECSTDMACQEMLETDEPNPVAMRRRERLREFMVFALDHQLRTVRNWAALKHFIFTWKNHPCEHCNTTVNEIACGARGCCHCRLIVDDIKIFFRNMRRTQSQLDHMSKEMVSMAKTRGTT